MATLQKKQDFQVKYGLSTVASHLPFLFHIVTLLVSTGPLSLRASTHGLVINIIHSLCTCSQLHFAGQVVCVSMHACMHVCVQMCMITCIDRSLSEGEIILELIAYRAKYGIAAVPPSTNVKTASMCWFRQLHHDCFSTSMC